jgi:hypothetical protein
VEAVPAAQTYSFAPVSGVAEVDFVIKANGGSAYTGVAEMAFSGFALPPPPGLLQPSSAVALSEFSAAYDIGNTIDGSGLPKAFGPDSLHADYGIDNHWTTQRGALAAGTAKASFYFRWPSSFDAFYLWNHRSNIIASDPDYAVTRFDMIFKDQHGVALFSLLDQSAAGSFPSAQTYGFAPVTPVAQVDFIIKTNQGSSLTGLAEVAFHGSPAAFLAIRIAGTSIEISWPASLTDYVLETVAVPGGPSWTEVLAQLQFRSNDQFVILPQESGSHFFRLHKL